MKILVLASVLFVSVTLSTSLSFAKGFNPKQIALFSDSITQLEGIDAQGLSAEDNSKLKSALETFKNLKLAMETSKLYYEGKLNLDCETAVAVSTQTAKQFGVSASVIKCDNGSLTGFFGKAKWTKKPKPFDLPQTRYGYSKLETANEVTRLVNEIAELITNGKSEHMISLRTFSDGIRLIPGTLFLEVPEYYTVQVK